MVRRQAGEGRNAIGGYPLSYGRLPLLSGQEERALIRQIRAGAGVDGRTGETRAARKHLVAANLRLVVSVARHHPGASKLDFLDLVQEGTLGLLRAIDSFDPDRGVRLGTYATWWIREAIGRAVADKGRTVRLPVGLQSTLRQVERVRAQMTQEQRGRQPSLLELAERLHWQPERLERLITSARREPISLNQPISTDGEDEFGDLIQELAGKSPEEAVLDAELGRAAVGALAHLDAREQQVLRLRFGLDDGQPHTLDEIGRMLSLSGERIRQVEGEGLRRVRAELDGA